MYISPIRGAATKTREKTQKKRKKKKTRKEAVNLITDGHFAMNFEKNASKQYCILPNFFSFSEI